MSRNVFPCILVVTWFLLTGCATTRYEEYGAVEEGPPERSAKPASPVILAARRDALGQIEARIDRLEEDLSTRLAGVEAGQGDLHAQLMSVAEQLEEIRGQLRLTEEGPTGAAPVKTVESNRKALSTSARPSDAYEAGHQRYFGRSYEEALQSFQLAQKLDPMGDLADNSQYWIGECEYALRRFTAAVEAFQRVLQFKETEKDDDAQLKLGLCYIGLGDPERAEIELERLVLDYPKSEYLGRARELIGKIRSEGAQGP